MNKKKTEQEAYLQLATLCAQAEHCQQDMRDKMKRWEMSPEEQQRVIDRLVKERYVDDERYTQAFVNDKIHYQKWGHRKIQQALWTKHIDEDILHRVLSKVSDEEYLATLRPLLQQKRKSTKATSDYELHQKLIRFALGRGFTYNIIRQCLSVDEEIELENYED